MSNPPTTSMADVVVIGAGPAGLAVARELLRVGRNVVILEQDAQVASSWRSHRPGLRLHTVRRRSALPGSPIPPAYGQYVLSADLVTYMERYAADHGLDIRFGVTVSRIERATSGPRRWKVAVGADKSFLAHTVIVATGYNRAAYTPDLPGRQEYRRPLLHVSQLRDASQFAGKDVLVVGSGNAASEALTELAAGGARRVRMAVRTAPHIVRKRVWGVSAQSIAIMVRLLPAGLANRAAAGLARATVPDLSRRNLSRPGPDLFTRAERHGSVPVHDGGLVALVASGVVEPVAGLAAFEGDGVRLMDGSVIHPDVVIAATGYRRALETLVPHRTLLDDRGNPVRLIGEGEYAGLHFVGFRTSASGALRDIAQDAARVAKAERAPQHGRRAGLSQEQIVPRLWPSASVGGPDVPEKTASSTTSRAEADEPVPLHARATPMSVGTRPSTSGQSVRSTCQTTTTARCTRAYAAATPKKDNSCNSDENQSTLFRSAIEGMIDVSHRSSDGGV